MWGLRQRGGTAERCDGTVVISPYNASGFITALCRKNGAMKRIWRQSFRAVHQLSPSDIALNVFVTFCLGFFCQRQGNKIPPHPLFFQPKLNCIESRTGERQMGNWMNSRCLFNLSCLRRVVSPTKSLNFPSVNINLLLVTFATPYLD